MRKVFSAFLVASVLLLCAAPVFSFAATAPFTYNTAETQPINDSEKWYYIFASSDSEGIIVVLESSVLPDYVSGGMVFNSSVPSLGAKFSRSGTYTFNLSYYDLSNGYLLSTETASISVSSLRTTFWYPSTIFSMYDYIDTPAYGYQLYNAPLYEPLTGSLSQVDPFVNWGVDPTPPTPPSPPVDPTEIIRSRIPRPYGHATTMYIADHLYLYAIYMGVPHQFEEQGIIQTSLDPSKYSGDNYNIYDVTFTASGSDLNMIITNRAQFSYNVIVSKYDVVDGSYISSNIRAITVATDPEHPSTNNMTISLSDPATYGIYQSGFFARSQIVAYPELRISWSDTIDYSLDFFVVRQGLVTIVEGINLTNSNFSSANSTLSSISSTSASILSQLQAFYSLMDSNWTWFKTTFYNNLNNQWNITNNYLLSIYNLLNETDETMTIEDDTSGVAAMESAKNDLVVTNAAGQTVDAGDAAAAGLSEAAVQIGEIAQPVSTINQLMQTIVFDKPKLSLPVIVALGLGLMVTILGKNKSD